MHDDNCTAFSGSRMLASGPASDVAFAAKSEIDRNPKAGILVFDNRTGQQIDFDLSGTPADIAQRLAKLAPQNDHEGPRKPGRPKLGVVAREVTLLPRHWEWLADQPGGASVALRKLVDAARKTPSKDDQSRLAMEATNRFMTAMAGNEPGYEEATRALFRGDLAKFAAEIASWPADVRKHAARMAAPVFSAKIA